MTERKYSHTAQRFALLVSAPIVPGRVPLDGPVARDDGGVCPRMYCERCTFSCIPYQSAYRDMYFEFDSKPKPFVYIMNNYYVLRCPSLV